MYRPNFCAACGARIERARWRWWTSRRFCPNCEQRFRRGRIIRPLIAGLLFIALGFGAGRLTRPAPPPLIASSAQPTHAAAPTMPAHPAPTNPNTNAAPAPAYGLDGTANERPTDPNEILYGASKKPLTTYPKKLLRRVWVRRRIIICSFSIT